MLPVQQVAALSAHLEVAGVAAVEAAHYQHHVQLLLWDVLLPGHLVHSALPSLQAAQQRCEAAWGRTGQALVRNSVGCPACSQQRIIL